MDGGGKERGRLMKRGIRLDHSRRERKEKKTDAKKLQGQRFPIESARHLKQRHLPVLPDAIREFASKREAAATSGRR